MDIGIFYFSGTGNTKIVAELFADNFKKNNHQVKIIKVEDITQNKTELDINNFDFIGIGHPIYAMYAPKIMNDFVKMLPSGRGKKTFIFKTAGDFDSINNGASKTLIKRLVKKEYSVIHESLTCMPSNWLIGYENALSKQLYETAIKRTAKYSTEILNGEKRIIKAGYFLKIFSLIANFFEENFGAKFFGRFLKIGKKCSNCNKCINRCPTENIYRANNNKIQFRWRCIWCMRCIYNCPKNAIKAGAFSFVVLKKGYDIEKIINDSSINGNFVNENTKGFYKHFYRYLNEF